MPAAARLKRREPAPRVRSPAQESLRGLRRGQIVAAARAIVAAGGLEALSFRTLEEQLGFTRGVITYHFEDKDDIVAAVLQSAAEEIDAATMARMEASPSLEDKVRAVLQTKVGGFLGHPEAAEILIAFWSRLAVGGPVQKVMADLFGTYRAQAAQLIRAARRLDARCQAEPQAMAALLVAIVIGLVVQTRFEPHALDIEAALDEAVASVLARLAP